MNTLTCTLVLAALGLALGATGCAAAARPQPQPLPGVDDLPDVDQLPDPFRLGDGSRVRTLADWARRRDEMKAMILYYEYGHLPPAPGNIRATVASTTPILDGAATEQRLTLAMGPDHKVSFHVNLITPAGKGPWPVIVRNDGDLGQVPIVAEVVGRGYMVAEYNRCDLAPDKAGAVGPAQAAYPDYDWATLAVWAWGGLRVIDYLETLPVVDKARIIATGHSRGGKTALLQGALDERIALTVPNGSGCGGAGCYRVKQGESLAEITDPKRFGYWFSPRFRQFADRETRLPFDQHFLKALVAPRALLSTDAIGDAWANPLGTQQTFVAARVVFEWLGAGAKCGASVREGGHDQNAEDWAALLDFADLVLRDKAPAGGRRFDQLRFPDAAPLFTWKAPPPPDGGK
ncbi:MAG: acetylxylan esterase [Planctomycetes bacterium]|nr:acetylxylan esterase [Planctomycetota bacterium]